MKIDGMKRARAVTLLPMLLLGACILDPDPKEETEPFGDADLSVLFVGNSLTYTNDMPVMLQVIAEVAGKSFEYRSLTAPNFSLEDHWVRGARDLITDLKADVVVLQQGPSSLPENQISEGMDRNLRSRHSGRGRGAGSLYGLAVGEPTLRLRRSQNLVSECGGSSRRTIPPRGRSLA